MSYFYHQQKNNIIRGLYVFKKSPPPSRGGGISAGYISETIAWKGEMYKKKEKWGEL